MLQTMDFIIAVHAGAGYHSPNKEAEYKQACSLACSKAMTVLRQGGTATDAVVCAVKYLEDAACTNAGYGSSLTIKGTVECDASVMDGRSLLYGAVGCLSGVKNPVAVAKQLLDVQSGGVLPLGRIPPCMMVGEGAAEWARGHGIPLVPPDTLKSGNALKTYENHKRRLQKTEDRMRCKRQKLMSQKNNHSILDTTDQTDNIPDTDSTDRQIDDLADSSNTQEADDSCINEDTSDIQDTVGAVCLDACGNMAAAASSGGISLKQPGRIGPAAMFGAGCWAQNRTSCDKPGVAIATSGTGEHIMRSLLARECAQQIQNEDLASQALSEVFRYKFLESDFLHHFPEKFGGVLVLKNDQVEDRSSVELLIGHSTASMCVGYMTSKQNKPKMRISRLPPDKPAGQAFIVEGRHFNL